ncbi:hypothetical protein DBT_1919 [Dissulfuribacter thermophilus]|uniref:Uncharacterized protein n=1 Tax=Dissulfuribacter thermophilus TaxID=1156395 RepID=A0A1B9F468_9BACT|nr:hypothetical protein DBT_1919 [Dissulfuribacter thermophilus]
MPTEKHFKSYMAVAKVLDLLRPKIRIVGAKNLPCLNLSKK